MMRPVRSRTALPTSRSTCASLILITGKGTIASAPQKLYQMMQPMEDEEPEVAAPVIAINPLRPMARDRSRG